MVMVLQDLNDKTVMLVVALISARCRNSELDHFYKHLKTKSDIFCRSLTQSRSDHKTPIFIE